MHPLLGAALGLGLVYAATSTKKAGAKQAPRVIDASGTGIRLLPAPPTKPAPKGQVTIGQPRVIKTAPKPAAKPAVKVAARPVPPAAPRTVAQASQPVRQTAAPKPNPKAAAATAAARAALPAAPAAARVKVAAPPGTDLALAKKTAKDTAAHIRNAGKLYKRDVLARFQRAAGLTADGLYGPVARSALSYFGAAPPAPLFKGQDLKYVPPGA